MHTLRNLTLIQWFLLIIGLILTLDGVYFITIRRINVGTILPLVIGGFLLFHTIFWQKIQCYLINRPKQQKLYQIIWLLFSLWIISLLIFFIVLYQHIQQSQQIPTAKVVIVLGSGFKNGKPSPTLANRLDKSAEIAKQQPKIKFILTGGLGFNEKLTEAEVMANYLHQTHGINYQQMLLEDKSTSTELNLKNSQPILAEHHIQLSEPIIIVSSDFHTLRAKKIAEKLGYQNITTVGSETPLSIRYNTWLREYFAFISGWILNEY